MSQKELQRKKRENMGAVQRTPYFSVFKKCYPQCINVFLVFFVTLALFPTVQSGMCTLLFILLVTIHLIITRTEMHRPCCVCNLYHVDILKCGI